MDLWPHASFLKGERLFLNCAKSLRVDKISPSPITLCEDNIYPHLYNRIRQYIFYKDKGFRVKTQLDIYWNSDAKESALHVNWGEVKMASEGRQI